MRNIWIVAGTFPPIAEIGAERAKKLANGLLGRGDRVAIFTVAPDGQYALGETYNGAPVYRSKLLLPKYSFRPARQDLTGLISKYLGATLTSVLDDDGWNWMLSLRVKLDAMAEIEMPQIVVVTGRPFLSMLVVRQFCRERGIPYIADFRDAWAENPHAIRRTAAQTFLIRKLEALVLRDAAHVTTVSRLTAGALNCAYPSQVMYNFPDRSYAEELGGYVLNSGTSDDTSRLLVCFAGMLYPGRDLDPLAMAIAKLPVADRRKLLVQYCGSSGARALSSFERFGVADCVKDYGRLSKREATRLINNSDIALSVISSRPVSDDASLKGVITTKIFDYLLLGKRVLNIVPEDYEISSLVFEYNLNAIHSIAPQNVGAIADYLSCRIRETMDVSGLDIPAEAARCRDELVRLWDGQMQRLSEVIDEILDQNLLN